MKLPEIIVFEKKIRSRYIKALSLVPELIKICDVMHIYDNTKLPERIFKKRKDKYSYWENHFWDKSKIERLMSIDFN